MCLHIHTFLVKVKMYSHNGNVGLITIDPGLFVMVPVRLSW